MTYSPQRASCQPSRDTWTGPAHPHPKPVVDAWPAAHEPDYTHPRCREVVSRIVEHGYRIVHMLPDGGLKTYPLETLRAIVSKCSVKYRGYSHPCMVDGWYDP